MTDPADGRIPADARGPGAKIKRRPEAQTEWARGSECAGTVLNVGGSSHWRQRGRRALQLLPDRSDAGLRRVEFASHEGNAMVMKGMLEAGQ